MRTIHHPSGDLTIHEDGRLYNVFSESLGYFKLKRIPLKWKFPHYDPYEDKWQWKPIYRFWHTWRMSPGEGDAYIGGMTICGAFNNMMGFYGPFTIIRKGKENADFVTEHSPIIK